MFELASLFLGIYYWEFTILPPDKDSCRCQGNVMHSSSDMLSVDSLRRLLDAYARNLVLHDRGKYLYVDC